MNQIKAAPMLTKKEGLKWCMTLFFLSGLDLHFPE